MNNLYELDEEDIGDAMDIVELITENDQLQQRIDKANILLKELNIKLKDILKIGIDIKEISDIQKILGGDE